MKLENSSVSSLDASDIDSIITDESSCSFSTPATSPCNKSQTNGDLISLDMKEIQRKRRQKRVEILRMKRQQRRSNVPSVRSISADEEISSPRESIDLSNITDPQLLRKLRNRESAARSRQKIIDLIDNLTFQLMERYVTLKDLQDQLTFLDQQNEINSTYTGTMNYSQYPSSHLTMMEVIPWQAMSSSTSTSNSSSPTFEMQLQEREFHLQQQSIPQDIGAVLNGLFVDLPPFNGGFEDIDSLYREMLFV